MNAHVDAVNAVNAANAVNAVNAANAVNAVNAANAVNAPLCVLACGRVGVRLQAPASLLTGFRNIGNTCYLNAVLAAVMHTSFRDCVLSKALHTAVNAAAVAVQCPAPAGADLEGALLRRMSAPVLPHGVMCAHFVCAQGTAHPVRLAAAQWWARLLGRLCARL